MEGSVDEIHKMDTHGRSDLYVTLQVKIFTVCDIGVIHYLYMYFKLIIRHFEKYQWFPPGGSFWCGHVSKFVQVVLKHTCAKSHALYHL